MRHEIDAGMRVGIDGNTASVNVLALPKFQKHTAERVAADPSHVRGARTEPSRSDAAIRGIAAKSMQILIARPARLVELDQRLTERYQVEARIVHRLGSSAAKPAAYAAATARTSSGAPLGRYKFEPVPKPLAPTAQYGAMLSGRIPPTGKTSVSGGSTARHAFNTAGDKCSAGNIFSPSAPAASAANASVGVATPGTQRSPCRFASRMTDTSPCGMTISLPPAAATRATSATSITVPAPVRHRCPNSR